ncbi:phospholipid/cholesterol/gamma-HCH transport system substrate-binding protein [Haloechinothrix alba]|uniref:Phospholipid/cholesterol/gamma-HCH transport system substrate-binding protein n=1 Tax=Haloechinothrix alba TaxID=664784 RepID=A0A238ZM52_9PSEU|nr:MlaD family protein [Haloechinothrix alba]SNR84199.1 phospholipid/cholesterol/gamma-HCH transport system substrate-binding protein [Haloechinothrix alba]
MHRRILMTAVVAVLAIAVSATTFITLDRSYTLTVMMPNASNLVEGGSVMRDGYEAGSISEISTEDGKAKVRLELDDEFAPLREGATVEVSWKAVLSERRLVIDDGPSGNEELPSGSMLTEEMAAPVELDQVLAILDEPTRDKLKALVDDVEGTLDEREAEINDTLTTAGPALESLGSVLRGIGSDGAAIKELITQLNSTMSIVEQRDQEVERVVSALGETTAETVEQHQQLGETLERLPEIVRQADSTLKRVPGAVDATVPLLEDLSPVTERMTSVSGNLRPVLGDLRPAVAELRPTLSALSELLEYTPGLLDTGRSTFPDAAKASRDADDALSFLRPYTPELAGFLSNWGSASGSYDANGHYARFFIQSGLEGANVNPGITGAGVEKDMTPMPGDAVDQPWTDAFGSGMR